MFPWIGRSDRKSKYVDKKDEILRVTLVFRGIFCILWKEQGLSQEDGFSGLRSLSLCMSTSKKYLHQSAIVYLESLSSLTECRSRFAGTLPIRPPEMESTEEILGLINFALGDVSKLFTLLT